MRNLIFFCFVLLVAILLTLSSSLCDTALDVKYLNFFFFESNQFLSCFFLYNLHHCKYQSNLQNKISSIILFTKKLPAFNANRLSISSPSCHVLLDFFLILSWFYVKCIESRTNHNTKREKQKHCRQLFFNVSAN